jgi:hypothetical protein
MVAQGSCVDVYEEGGDDPAAELHVVRLAVIQFIFVDVVGVGIY